MAPTSKPALFLALNLLFATVHGCQPHCPTPPVEPHPPPVVPTPPPVVPTPPVVPKPSGGHCPIDALKMSVCANVLNLLKLKEGVPENEQCCPLLSGLADHDAAVCLCTAMKAKFLGTDVNMPVDLIALLNHCGKTCPSDFTCPLV